jgi:hypothetical protein
LTTEPKIWTIHDTIDDLIRKNVTLDQACSEAEKKFISVVLHVIKREIPADTIPVRVDVVRAALTLMDRSERTTFEDDEPYPLPDQTDSHRLCDYPGYQNLNATLTANTSVIL